MYVLFQAFVANLQLVTWRICFLFEVLVDDDARLEITLSIKGEDEADLLIKLGDEDEDEIVRVQILHQSDSNNNELHSNDKQRDATDVAPKSLHYRNAYRCAYGVEMNNREGLFLIPNEPIHVRIIGYEEESSLVLNTTM